MSIREFFELFCEATHAMMLLLARDVRGDLIDI
jgi:hypothetical protein